VSKITGGCRCGAIRYETEAAPAAMLKCLCRDCLRAGGSGYAPVMAMPAPAVKPDLIGIQAASLDDPSLFKPELDIFAEHAWPWDHLSPSTEKRPLGMF
jgi:hypothetical protein